MQVTLKINVDRNKTLGSAFEIILILGMNTCHPELLISNTWSVIHVITSLVSLHTHSMGFKFLSTITEHLNFSFKSDNDIPDTLMELRYSIGYCTIMINSAVTHHSNLCHVKI